jgi:lactate dehydrogenase-like 2-hydroxyacid dehydrogenase
MPRPASTIDEQDLERALLRKSVGALATDVHRCADCGRTPLIG